MTPQYFFLILYSKTWMKAFWYTFHTNRPLYVLPGKICWLGLDSWSLQQLWKYDRLSALWMFKLMFLEGCCSAWCYCVACLNGSSAGGGSDWPSAFRLLCYWAAVPENKSRDTFWGSAHVNWLFPGPYGRHHHTESSVKSVIVQLLDHIYPHLSSKYQHKPLHLKSLLEKIHSNLSTWCAAWQQFLILFTKSFGLLGLVSGSYKNSC